MSAGQGPEFAPVAGCGGGGWPRPRLGVPFRIIPSPELLGPPDTNAETEDSSSQRWPCLLALNSPTLPCLPVGGGDGAICQLPAWALTTGSQADSDPTPTGRGADFPKRVGQACWLVLRSGLDAAQTLLRG